MTTACFRSGPAADGAIWTRLKIKTIGAIDCGKAKCMTCRRRKRIAAYRARRAKAGARPHAQSAAANHGALKAFRAAHGTGGAPKMAPMAPIQGQ